MIKFAAAAEIDLPDSLPEKAIHNREFYQDLFNNDNYPEYFELLADASIYAFSNWNYAFYSKIMNETFDNKIMISWD